MMRWAILLPFALYAQAPPPPATEAQAAELRALIGNSPKLSVNLAPLEIQRPNADWTAGYISSVTTAPDGTIYLVQRELKFDPVVVLDQKGRILRSWGTGLSYKIPHSIRIDPQGNVWTVDAGNSMIYKFTREGKKLLEIDVGGLPDRRSEFRGTADITFAPGGRLFVADGYGNARVLEYNAAGKKVREWGSHGTKPGQFNLVHGIACDRDGILYVADRENGRIQRFDLEGRHLGEWGHLGKTFSLTLSPQGDLWIGTQPRNVPNGAEGWIVKVDRKSGKVLGHVPSPGTHSVDVNSKGEVFTGSRSVINAVVWFRK